GMFGPSCPPMPPGKSEPPQFTAQSSSALNFASPFVRVTAFDHRNGLAGFWMRSVSSSHCPDVASPIMPTASYGADAVVGIKKYCPLMSLNQTAYVPALTGM